MAIVRFNTATGNDVLTAIKNRLDAGAGNSVLDIYTGAMPATPETAVTTQTKLGTLTLSDPCGTVSAKTLTFSAITSDSAADATGTAAWGRFKDGDGNGVIDCDVTSTAGTGAIRMNTTSVVADGPISATSAVISIQ